MGGPGPIGEVGIPGSKVRIIIASYSPYKSRILHHHRQGHEVHVRTYIIVGTF